VPKRHAVVVHPQDSAFLGLAEYLELDLRQGLGQLEGDRPRDHAELGQRLLAALAQPPDPGDHRVGDRGRHRARRAGEHLGDEERVATGQRVQGEWIPVRPREFPHGVDRQRLQSQAPHRAQRTQPTVQRVIGRRGTIPHGHHDQGTQRGNPPGQVAEHVQGGVVGPVHVLDDHYGESWPGELGDCRVEYLLADTIGQRLVQRATRAGRGVAQRAERPRGQQVVAHAAQHPRVAR
jgi:hypothetical protein